MSLNDWNRRRLCNAAALQDGLDRLALHLNLSPALRGAVSGALLPRGRAAPIPDTGDDAAIAAAMAGSPASAGLGPETDGDEAYARALARESGSALSQLEIENRARDEAYARALARESGSALSQLEIEDRAHADSLSRRALCNISCVSLPGGPTQHGTLIVDGAEYRAHEAGATAGGDSNMCFYLSVAVALGGCLELADLESRACSLKRALAPRADRLARDAGMEDGGYALLGSAADTPVVLACVEHTRRPLCIYSSALIGSSHAVLLYRAPGSAGSPLVLHFSGSHYQPCLPAWP